MPRTGQDGASAYEAAGSVRSAWTVPGPLLCVAALLLVVHFALGNRYGFHRDELQFLSDARHPAWGYVAYPPMTAFCGRVAIALFGISPGVLRLPAALANGITLVLAGLLARELGGQRAAQVLTALAVLPLAVVFSSVLQYNTFDLLAWTIAVLFTARVLRTGDARNWLGVGVGVGLGVLSKYTIALPVVSLLVGLAVLPSQRRHLRSQWFWLGALVALLLAAPNGVWLARHHWITLTMEQFIHKRDVRLGRASGYWTDQLKFTMLALPLAVLGLVTLLRSERFRLLAVFYMGPLLLLAVMQGRGYYLLPGYTVLYAAAMVFVERRLHGGGVAVRAAVRAALVVAIAANTAVVSWVYLPLFAPGSKGWNWQMAHNPDLADEIGWRDLAAQVAAVRNQVPLQERPRLAVLANNYGEAGALELYGPEFHLPRPISSVNSFAQRGYGPYAPETVIVLGSHLEDQLKNFESCQVVGRVGMPFGVRNEETEDHPEILLCRHLRKSWDEAWPRAQQFG